MRRSAKLLLPAVAVLAVAAAGCGTDEIDVAKSSPSRRGALLFKERCAGCHTLNAAGTHGSAANIRTRERNDGTNFNIRCESSGRVLYAIRNGGFSGAIMPQNIVVGPDANAVANFVSKYAGRTAAGAQCGTSATKR
jgi:mono/diheme cytochrome c family protein